MKRIAHTGTLLGVLASGLQVVELSYNSEGTGWEADNLILGGVPMVYNGVKFGVIESLPGCGKKTVHDGGYGSRSLVHISRCGSGKAGKESLAVRASG